MATLLLIVIYIAFIGLGVPDSLFGTAWPAIYTDLNLPVSWASIVTINQSAPENGTAVVSVTLRTDAMPMPIDDVLLSIQNQRTVVSIRRMANER